MTVKICRCCGKDVFHSDNAPIHTRCIKNHWLKHQYKISHSRCKEFQHLRKPMWNIDGVDESHLWEEN